MSTYFRLLIVLLLVAFSAAAQSVSPPPKPLHLVGDHWTPYEPPTEFAEGANIYIIVSGDTLWDLAQKNLGDPYLWPQIWEQNPYILDSHWIYPGDPLVIDLQVGEAGSEMTEEVVEGEESMVSEYTEPTEEGQEDLEGSADWVEESAAQELIPYPLGSSADVYCFARLVQDESIFRFTITSAEDIDLQADYSVGDIVYIDGGSEDGVNPGDRFFILLKHRSLHHPVSNANLGMIYTQLGHLKVLCVQERTAICEIIQACDIIPLNAVLLPYQPVPVPLVMEHPKTQICDPPSGMPVGYLTFTKDDALLAATGQLVFVNLGLSDGAYPGQFATVFRENPSPGMPRIIAGEVGILTVEETYSTAKITYSTGPLNVGDRVELK